jgi:hypothetical protein
MQVGGNKLELVGFWEEMIPPSLDDLRILVPGSCTWLAGKRIPNLSTPQHMLIHLQLTMKTPAILIS